MLKPIRLLNLEWRLCFTISGSFLSFICSIFGVGNTQSMLYRRLSIGFYSLRLTWEDDLSNLRWSLCEEFSLDLTITRFIARYVLRGIGRLSTLCSYEFLRLMFSENMLSWSVVCFGLLIVLIAGSTNFLSCTIPSYDFLSTSRASLFFLSFGTESSLKMYGCD